MAIQKQRSFKGTWSTVWTGMRDLLQPQLEADSATSGSLSESDSDHADALVMMNGRTTQPIPATANAAVVDSPFILQRSFTERWPPKSATSDWHFSGLPSEERDAGIDVEDIRIYTSTWNVGGKTPGCDFRVDEMLQMSNPSDVYVLGFQEIVPLNAATVLGKKASGPVTKWLSLINETLNGHGDGNENGSSSSSSISSQDSDPESSPSAPALYATPPNKISTELRREPDPALKKADLSDKSSEEREVKCGTQTPHSSFSSPHSRRSLSETSFDAEENKYSMIVCKQMAGIFLCVWIRTELKPYVHSVRVSSVRRGLRGYLRNKGCVSVSLMLHDTSFCFMCCHLASGQKEGDELKRNCDVSAILKKTCFRSHRKSKRKQFLPSILEHDQIIWLGDMNYRISLSYSEITRLIENNDWEALLQKDQLRNWQNTGKIFQGWNEGKISFAPTYKYAWNSDHYVGENVKEKPRTPAWCDRILWYGNGLKQLSYVRAESSFSDHRPVYATFLAELKSTRLRKLKRFNTR